MIVLVVDENYVLTVETKCEPPVPTDPDRPMAGKLGFQGMQDVAGSIHIAGPGGDVQSSEEPPQLRSMRGLNAGLGTCFREELQSFVAIALDHAYSVYEHYTESKRKRPLATQTARQ